MRQKIAIVVALVVVGILAGASAVGQNPAPPSLKEQLDAQYKFSNVLTDGSVQAPGTVLVIQQKGIEGVPLTDAAIPTATYKGGALHKPSAGSKFGANFMSNLAQPNSDASSHNTRAFAVGEKVYVMKMDVNLKKDRITLSIAECASCNGADPSSAYKAAVSFDFAKGSLATKSAPEVEDAIAKVFTIDTGQAQAPPEQPAAAQQAPIPGLYVDHAGTQLQLNPDGSFSQHSPNGQVSPGHYTVNGDTLVLTYLASANPYTFKIQGGKIYTQGFVWSVRQGDAPAPAASLKLPATYVSAQAATDQLQLNADNSFSLQEAGQAYHGTFAVNGNTLELSISESNTKTTATLQGNNLTDSSGQTWVLREQSSGTPRAGTVLQNEDVIKMAKAGLDDAIIIAKISSSKCQFDTSTDALIRLKQSGVTAAVLKAMVGAGK